MTTLVFSDLDGTLLDYHTYSSYQAERAILWLKAKEIPLIFCSSKTFEEQVYLQKQLAVSAPFIFENGCGIAFPEGYFPGKDTDETWLQQGRVIVPLVTQDIRAVRRMLQQVAQAGPLPGPAMSQADEATIAAATSLANGAIARAQARIFSETLLTPTLPADITAWLQQAGMAFSRGGRFVTVQPAGADKGRAVRWLTDAFRSCYDPQVTTIGIGDSPNDAAMLAATDVAYQVQRHDGNWEALSIPGIIRLEAIGPEGFAMLPELLEPAIHQSRI